MKAIRGRILVRMDTLQKTRYTMGNGATLQIERGYNFNRREDYPSLATLIDGDGIPLGAEVLLHHNVSEKTYAVEGEQVLTDEEKRAGIMILSVPEDMCFCYREAGGEWQPYKNFLLTERIFKKYDGWLVGIELEQVKNRMYVVNGFVEYDGEKCDLSGLVVVSTENCDYEIIFFKNGTEGRLIRTREREILGIDHGLLQEINEGKYLVGVNKSCCRKIKSNAVVKELPAVSATYKNITAI